MLTLYLHQNTAYLRRTWQSEVAAVESKYMYRSTLLVLKYFHFMPHYYYFFLLHYIYLTAIKQDIWRSHLALWETVIDIVYYSLVTFRYRFSFQNITVNKGVCFFALDETIWQYMEQVKWAPPWPAPLKCCLHMNASSMTV